MDPHKKRDATFQVNNLRALRRVCEEGTGIAVLPDYIVEDRHALQQLATYLLQEAPNALLNRGAWISGLGMAMKSMSVFPENKELPSIQGGVLVFDDKDGSLKAIIDGILVTKWKTAGDSVLGARLLANPEPKTHLMIGAGTVAASILDAYHEVFPSIENFIIYNRTQEKAQSLAQQLSPKIPGIKVATDLQSACGEADIITSATMTISPIIKGDWINPGTHVDLIGAFKPNMREADDALMRKSEIFVDSRETTIGHIGEIDIPLQEGTITKEDILGDYY
ncbi:Delta(1)-pyrroline-2-carboxylate reductase [Nymphon striatum]|nr:Delta(1)-pyrroline-2-carboxylate reductase [Nymphon striatum]